MNRFVRISFLFFFFFLSGGAQLMSTPEPILDDNSDTIHFGVDYHLVGIGSGGVNVRKGKNDSCPFQVFNLPYDFLTGAPVAFSPSNYEDRILYTSTDVNIKFTFNLTECDESRVWKVDDYDDSTGHWYVTTDGVEGSPGYRTQRNWFKFERVKSEFSRYVYKIVHCPSVCDWCVNLCSNVGPYDGQKSLVLSEKEFWVKFVKVARHLRIMKKPSTMLSLNSEE